jgi:anthraniloyl-CoA monooxygenase
VFQTRLDDVATVAGASGGYDLIVAADGAYSRTRAQYGAQFGTTVDEGRRRYCWLGSRRIFDRVRLSFQENEHGFFYAYAYQYDPECSTVIAECDLLAWRRAGLDRADEAATRAYLERAFRDDLGGQPLLAQGSRWSSVLTVQNTRWWCRAGDGADTPHIVLLGDAAHTAHFTVGLATRAAMLDAATLVAALHDHRDADEALVAYEAERKPVADAAQQQADEAVSWLADVSRHLHFVSLVCGR